MTDQETSVANFFETDLTVEMGATDLTATVASTTGLTSPTFLVIEPDTASQREVILFDGTFTGTTFVTSTINNRYLAGSGAGSGITHPVGSKVRSAPLAQHLDDLNDRVEGHDHDGADSSLLAAGSVGTTQIANGAVDTNQLADLAVTLSKIADLTIGSAKLGTGSVTTQKIAFDAVTQPRIAPGAVETLELADDAVTGAKASNTFFQDFEVDNSTEVASSSLTGTFANVASVTLAIPAGWGSWKCEAWASYVATGNATNSYDVAIRIDGTDQQVKTGLGIPGEGTDASVPSMDGAVGGRRTGLTTTGSRTVTLRAKESGGVTLSDIYLFARAVRTS